MVDLHNGIAQITPILATTPIIGDAEGTGTWQGLLIFVTLALGVSFLCSILEAVMLSTSVSYVELGVGQGKRSARLMQKHKLNVERPIAAILTLNTIAHTVGAAGAGAEAVGIFGSEMFGLISAVLTFAILVFSEIIPKTLGANYWKHLNPFAAYTIQVLVWVLFPLVWFLEQTTRLLGTPQAGPTVSRMELEAMARISASEGALLDREIRILRNLLHLRSVQVRDIMTPRTVVLAFQQDMTVRDVVEAHENLPYSRIPIFNESTDDISGFVLRQDIFARYAGDERNTPLSAIKREINVVPETNTVAKLLDEFMTQQQHIALVIDEYGGTAGIVTMEDALETLLGIEITDESDTHIDLRKLAEQRYARQQKLLSQLGQASPQPPSDPAGGPSLKADPSPTQVTGTGD